MKTQVAIVGGGPAGSASALFLGQRGIDCVVIEEDSFPRFHVGESLTGWAAETVRNFGLGEEMVKRKFPVKYAGTVYGTSGAGKFDVVVSARINEQERREVPTWQVKRSEFDKLLLDTAIGRGADFISGRATEPIIDDTGKMAGVRVQSNGRTETIEADVVIDASGRKTWLSTLGVAGTRQRGGYENQIALFSHVTGAVRNPEREEGNTLLFYRQVDHWAWFIPVDPEVVSIGIVTPASYYKSKKESKEQFYLRELREMNPGLTPRVEDVELVEPVHASANFSYRINEFTGPGWLCVGDAHRFIDPFFSFGVHLALAEGQKAAEYIAGYLDRGAKPTENPFLTYQAVCDRGMDVVQDLIDSFWANPLAWGYLLHYTEHKGEILDIFGGRIYEEEPLAGLLAMRRILEKARAKQSVA